MFVSTGSNHDKLILTLFKMEGIGKDSSTKAEENEESHFPTDKEDDKQFCSNNKGINIYFTSMIFKRPP